MKNSIKLKGKETGIVREFIAFMPYQTDKSKFTPFGLTYDGGEWHWYGIDSYVPYEEEIEENGVKL